MSGLTITEEERQLIVGALDSLGVSLLEHHHVWSDGERSIYEEAMRLLLVPSITDSNDYMDSDLSA